MKIFDLIRMALKNLKGRWVVLPIMGIAISAFCLCFAGAVLTTVGQEKAQPYELVLSAESAGDLSASTLDDISKLPDVEAVTPLLKVSARVKTGEYSAQLMLTGINSLYLKRKFTAGRVFPDSGIMPYIVLNEAACKQFSDKNTDTEPETGNQPNTDTRTNNNEQPDTGTDAKTGNNSNTNTGKDIKANTNTKTNTGSNSPITNNTNTVSNANANAGTNTNINTDTGNNDNTDAPKIDWLNTGFSLQSGDERWIVSKVCGILADAEDKDLEKEPAAYISLSTAKDLLQKSGQSTDYTSANVRITNIGCADSVSRAITALGLNVTNTDATLQAKWDTELGEMTYLIVLGVFCLLCTVVLMVAWRKISLLEQEAWTMLRWMGMKGKDIRRLFITQATMISLIGIFVGIIVSISLPSFLPPDLNGTSIFTFQTPFVIAILSIAICIVSSVIPLFKIKKPHT